MFRIKLAKLIYLRFMGKDAPKSISSIIKEPTKQYILQKIKEAKVLKKVRTIYAAELWFTIRCMICKKIADCH